MYLNPAHDPNCTLSPDQLQQHFDLFYEDIFTELGTKYIMEPEKACRSGLEKLRRLFG